MYKPDPDIQKTTGYNMNAVQINESDKCRPYLDQPRPQPVSDSAHKGVGGVNKEESADTPLILYSAVNPEQLFAIQQNNWQSYPEHLFALLKLRPVSNQRTAEDIAQQWYVQKSGAGFVISFRVDVTFLHTLPVSELMGEQDYEFHVSASTIKPLNKNIIGSISIIKAFYAAHSRRKIDYKLPND